MTKRMRHPLVGAIFGQVPKRDMPTPVAPVAEPEITVTFKLQELRGLVAAAAIGAKGLAKPELTDQVYTTCKRLADQTGRFDDVGRERK